MDFRYAIEVGAAFTGIFAIALGAVMLMTRRDRPDIWYFTCAIFASGLWILAVYFSDVSTDLLGLAWWTKAASVAALGYSMFFALFAYAFRYGAPSIGQVLALGLPALLNGIYIATFDSNSIYVSDPFSGFGYDRPVGGVLSGKFSAFLILYFIYYLLGFVILTWRGKSLSARQRLQAKYIRLGVSVSIVAAVLFDIILPLYGIDYLYALGPACSLFLVAAISYAIAQHNLLDIRVVIQRGLIYSVVLALFICVYLGCLALAGVFVQELTEAGIVMVAGATALGGIIGAPALEAFFRRATNRWFFKYRYDYGEALHELSETINTAFDLETLVGEVSSRLKTIFNAKGVAMHVSLEESNQALAEKEYEVVVPVGNPTSPTGMIGLSPKLSGDPYTDEDIRLLQTFSNQLAVAIEKAALVSKLKEHAEKLEERVRDRTEEVRLLQGKQSFLIENMSHELQMPLTVLKGELGELRNRGLLPNVHALFEKSIDDASRHLYKLMKLARMEMDGDAVKAEAVDLSLLLDEVVEYLDVVCRENNIRVEAEIAPGVIVKGDRNALNDLVINLMSNAIKYISGERVIQIRLTGGKQALLEIKDTGVGIAASDLPHIFDRFFHGRSKPNPATPSTGLGLAICRQIVEKHGGKIAAESTQGQGSTFTVTLPLARAED